MNGRAGETTSLRRDFIASARAALAARSVPAKSSAKAPRESVEDLDVVDVGTDNLDPYQGAGAWQ